ncbi:MAG: hypothetical protein ABIC04_07950 [Nanoarchaeota archaeon]
MINIEVIIKALKKIERLCKKAKTHIENAEAIANNRIGYKTQFKDSGLVQSQKEIFNAALSEARWELYKIYQDAQKADKTEKALINLISEEVKKIMG